jgi:hypothetical protein
VGHVARIGENRKLKERDYLEDLGVDGRIAIKWSLKKSVGSA